MDRVVISHLYQSKSMQTKYNYYIRNINKVLDYIDSHLAQPFTLEELSLQANFSKYHFHRIFQSIIGESPFQYILRLRLQKAASLIHFSSMSLTMIAYECGFSDLAIFSRNFKKHFGSSPSNYKKTATTKSNLSQINSKQQHIQNKPAPYFCSHSNTIKWISNMDIIKNIEVKDIATIAVAYNRSFGPYKGNNDLYQKHRGELFAWAASKELMSHPNFKYLILYHDNPNVALNDTQRMSLCVTIPPATETNGAIGKMNIEAGKYAIFQCELTAADFPKVWEWIYGQWFPISKYTPDDKPYFELYPEQPKGEVFKVEFCIPVKAM